MKMKIVGLVIAGLMLIAGSSQAAMLQLTPATGTGSTLPSNFDPFGFPGGVTAGVTPITIYANGDIGGLELIDGSATLLFEYQGRESAATNTFSFSSAAFSTATSSVGDSSPVAVVPGIIPFTFSSGGLSATNGGPIDMNVSIAFAALGDGSFLALFNDNGDDNDFDDIVVKVSISQVPLPAAAWLLISAILGLVSFARVRRTGARTA